MASCEYISSYDCIIYILYTIRTRPAVDHRLFGTEPFAKKEKAVSFDGETALIHMKTSRVKGNTWDFQNYLSAAAGAAGAFLFHPGQNEALSFGKIDGRVREHLVRPVFQKDLEAVLFEGHVSRLGGFGYVHSQRGASAAGDQEYPDPVSRGSLLGNHFLELAYRAVCNTYHYFLLILIYHK